MKNNEKVAQENLPEILPNYDAIVVRSATKVRQSLIDQCPNLKVIARGGVGLDNIDVKYFTVGGITLDGKSTERKKLELSLVGFNAWATMLKVEEQKSNDNNNNK